MHYYSTASVDLFNAHNISYLQDSVQRQLGGKIRPSPQVVMNVLDNVAKNYRPHTGDINSRYIQGGHVTDWKADINHKTITIIANAIRDEYDQQHINSSLSVWPRDDLRSHGPLKIKQNDHIKGVFMMNY